MLEHRPYDDGFGLSRPCEFVLLALRVGKCGRWVEAWSELTKVDIYLFVPALVLAAVLSLAALAQVGSPLPA